MVNLRDLIDYFTNLADHDDTEGNRVAGRIEGLHGFTVDTVDAEAGKKYQGLKREQLPVLGLLLPSAQSNSENVDAVTERNFLVLVLLDKCDPQRKKDAVQTCIETQPIIEAIKRQMIDDKAEGCHMLDRLDIASFTTMPETSVYSSLAGWSLGMSFDTVGL